MTPRQKALDIVLIVAPLAFAAAVLVTLCALAWMGTH